MEVDGQNSPENLNNSPNFAPCGPPDDSAERSSASGGYLNPPLAAKVGKPFFSVHKNQKSVYIRVCSLYTCGLKISHIIDYVFTHLGKETWNMTTNLYFHPDILILHVVDLDWCMIFVVTSVHLHTSQNNRSMRPSRTSHH